MDDVKFANFLVTTTISRNTFDQYKKYKMAEAVILQNCFQLLPGKQFYEVRLTRDKLVYQPTSIDSCCNRSSTSSVLCIGDIYGARLFRSRENEDDNAYISIYSCPKRGNRRQRRTIRFKVSGWEDVESNIRLAEQWVKMISWLAREPDIDTSTVKDRDLPSCRKLLILVNPSSGQGKSLKIFHQQVAPMFTEASINFNLLVTDYAGHAKNIALSLSVEEWDGIVICSGDGLVYEFVNGLMNRPDWEKAIHMPIGVIPTGSGNALCYSSLYASGEPFDITAAIFATICGQTYDLDICTFETPTKKHFSFLSLTWGIVSDVDIESEKHRYLGNARFTVGALIRILGLRIYRGRMAYLPFDEEPLEITENIDVPKEGLAVLDIKNSPGFHSFGSPSGTFFINGNFEEKDRPSSQENTAIIHSTHPSVNNVDSVGVIEQKSRRGPPTPLLPPLSCPLPANWKTVEGEFILGSTVLLTHLGPDIISAPAAKFGDGAMYVSYVRSGVSRFRLLSLFGQMEDGSHVNNEECVTVKARAFRLEPDLSQSGTLAIDGESVPYSAIQGQIHKGLGRLMCLRSYK